MVKSRPLREIGAEQVCPLRVNSTHTVTLAFLLDSYSLLIDLQSIKAYLSKRPGDALTMMTYASNTCFFDCRYNVSFRSSNPVSQVQTVFFLQGIVGTHFEVI